MLQSLQLLCSSDDLGNCFYFYLRKKVEEEREWRGKIELLHTQKNISIDQSTAFIMELSSLSPDRRVSRMIDLLNDMQARDVSELRRLGALMDESDARIHDLELFMQSL